MSATTTVEVVQEFAHAYARRRPRQLAGEHARRYTTLLGPLLVVDEEALGAGLRLFERQSELDAFDAVLAAAAIRAGADALVSADRAFSRVRGLRHVAPGSRAFDELVG